MRKGKINNPYREYKATLVANPLVGIQMFVGKGGLVSFEHGYKKPKFKHNGNEYICSMVSDTIAYCKKSMGGTETRPCNLILLGLGKQQLNKLYNELKKYELYCKYEA